MFPTSSTTCASTTRVFMEFATETQTGPSRWTTDDVDVIPPTMLELQPELHQTGPSRWTTDDVDVIPPAMLELQPELHQTGPSRWTTDDVDVIPPTMPHSQTKWPLPITLFAVTITLVFIGMKWRKARSRRKLAEWRCARSVSAARLPKAFATGFPLPDTSSRLSR